MANIIGFISAGNLSLSWAAYATSQGFHTIISGLPGHPGALPALTARNNTITCSGDLTGEYTTRTGEVADVIASADTVVVTAPAHSHAALARLLTNHDLRGKVFYAVPLNNFMMEMVRAFSGRMEMLPEVRGVNSSPWICFSSGASTRLNGTKAVVHVGSNRGPLSAAHHAQARTLFPANVRFVPNLLHVWLCNHNPEFHIWTMLRNTLSISQGKGNLQFYRHLAPKATPDSRALDAERVELGRLLGVNLLPLLPLTNELYGVNYGSLEELVENLPAYGGVKAPATLNHRFLLEDADVVVTRYSVAKKLGSTKTAKMEETIRTVGMILGKDLFKEGPTLENLGFGHLDATGVVHLLKTGCPKLPPGWAAGEMAWGARL